MLVIEGDNGSGKDTLADRLTMDSWQILSRDPDIVREKELASRLRHKEKFEAFLEYNRKCAEKAVGNPRSILIRYWPSTLCGGYADNIVSWEEFQTHVESAFDTLPVPALVLFLKCSLESRRIRVKERGLVLNGIDDLSERRDRRYQKAIEWLGKHSNWNAWKTLDVSDLDREQVYEDTKSMLSKEKT